MLNSVKSKRTAAMVVTELDVASDKGSASYEPHRGGWRSLFEIKGPWLGMGALLAVICFSVAQFLVLHFANHASSTQWNLISPNVCLSLLSNLSNLLVVFAIGNGIAIAWWRKARHPSATKEKLQKSWTFSNSSFSLLKNIRHLNNIALTTLMAKIALIDGVLFQTAIGTYIDISWEATGPSEKDSEVVVAFSQTTLPITGYMTPDGTTGGQTESSYTYTITTWLDIGNGINNWDIVYNCNGVGCVYGLKGIGFVVDCNTTNVTDAIVNSASISGNDNNTIFSVDWDWHFPEANKNYSSIIMNAKWPAMVEDDGTCSTIFTTSQCEFRPAVLNYTVAYTNFTSVERSKFTTTQIENGNPDGIEPNDSWGSQLSYSCVPPASAFTVFDYSDKTEDCGQYSAQNRQIVGIEVVAVQDIYEPYVASGESRLAGIFNALKDQFTSKATLIYNDGNWSVEESGALAPIKAGLTPFNSSWCNHTYTDPTKRVVTRLNTLMLQTSVGYYLHHTAVGEYNIEIPAYQYYKDIYFVIDFRYAFIALGLTFVVVACILPSYWEFWTLEKEVTLEPFEIADSFRDLIFRDESTNTNGGRDNTSEITGTIC